MSSIYGTKSSKGWQLRLDYSVSQSGNTSTISMTLYIYDGTGYSSNQNNSGCYYILNGGSKIWNKYTYNSTGWYKLGTGTKTVTHNDDGTASNATISASWHSGFDSSYTPSSLSVSGSVPLPTIPRASKITSASNVTLGNACSVKWTPASSSFKYKLRFSIASDCDGTTYYRGSSDWDNLSFINPQTTSAYTYSSFEIPIEDVSKRITTSTTGQMKVELRTYNSSGTLIGSTDTKYFTVTVPSNVKPTVNSFTAELKAGWNSKYIQNKSYVNLSFQGSGKYGSKITGYSITGSVTKSTTLSTSLSPYSGSHSTSIFTTSGSKTFYIQFKDSRGRWSEKRQLNSSINVLEYSKPTIKITSAARDENNNSNVKITYTTSYSSLGNANSITEVHVYRRQTGGTFLEVTLNSGIVSGCNTNTAYEFYAVAKDSYGSFSNNSATVLVNSLYRLVNFNSTNDGIAFGKIATGAGFDCNMNATFSKPASFNSTINATGRITGAGFTSSGTINSSGNITVTRSGLEPTVKVDNETNSCSIMVGASTNNAGLYNHTKGAWDVYRDSSGALKMAGHTITGDTTCLVSGGSPYISVNNGTKKCGIYANTNNNRGLYDSTAGKWDIYRDSDDNLTVATCNIIGGSTIGGYTPLTSNNYNSYAATKGHNHREGLIGNKTSTTSYLKVNSTATNCRCFLVKIVKSSVHFSTVVYIGAIGEEYTYGISVGTDYISFTCKLDSDGYFYIKRSTTPHYMFYVYGII